jgi:hypothetical protein
MIRKLIALGAALGLAAAVPAHAQITPPNGGGGSGAPNWFPGWTSGFWYIPYSGALSAGTALVANRIACLPFSLPAQMTVRTLGARITTASSGGNIQLAVYGNSGSRPNGAPLATTPSISTTSAGLVAQAPTQGNVTLPAGVYWGCVNADSTAGGVATTTTLSLSTVLLSVIAGTSAQSDGNDGAANSRPYIYASQTFGVWPSVTPSSWAESVSQSATAFQLQSN